MLQKTILTLCILLLPAYGLFAAEKAGQSEPEENLSSLTAEEIRHIEETTWRIDVVADIENTSINAAQFSIFEQDPLPLLRKAMEQRRQLNEGKKLTEFDRQISVQVDWDSIFDTISGRDVWLIQAKTGQDGGSIISANTPNAKKWLVTKIVHKTDGSFAAWIIPFDAEIGKTQKIALDDKNSFNMDSL